MVKPRPWAQPPFKYTPPLDRTTFSWPDDRGLAALVYLNLEYFLYDSPAPIGLSPAQVGRSPDVLNYAWREYGMRVGVWRMMEVLDRYQIGVTVGLNSEVCRQYPTVVEACLTRNWEITGHGVTNSIQLYGLSREDQRIMIQESLATIESTTGIRPHGWLGPGLAETHDTLRLLCEEGITYVADWGTADDIPFWLHSHSTNEKLLAMPYSLETNDLTVYLLQRYDTPQAFRRFTAQFDTLFAESSMYAKVFVLVLHPYLSGVPHRIGMLNEFFEYVRSDKDVWWTRADEMDTWFRSKNSYTR
jgi:peptidoglycan/xylan/chitin deacetylase (PgdA/CDA1 family)